MLYLQQVGQVGAERRRRAEEDRTMLHQGAGQYAVVDLTTRQWRIFADGQSAWTVWQNCWLGGNAQSMSRYTQGKVSSMKKYLLPTTPRPASYQDDGLDSRL